MESRPPVEEDYDVIVNLLRKIYWEAAARFQDAHGTPFEIETWIFENSNNIGVQTILSGEDFVVSYISFENDPEDQAVLDALDGNLAPYIQDAETEALFVNINANNRSVVRHFHRPEFRKDKWALEFTFAGDDWPRASSHVDLTKKGFRDEDFNDYLWLLDTAYRPVLLEDGLTPDPHRRNVKRAYSVLKSAHESGDFMTYWKGDSIVGLYLLSENNQLAIAVAPVYQGMGIGTAILSDVLERMVDEIRYKQILLYVSETNEIAIGLYVDPWFEKTGSHVDFTYLPSGPEQPGNFIKT